MSDAPTDLKTDQRRFIEIDAEARDRLRVGLDELLDDVRRVAASDRPHGHVAAPSIDCFWAITLQHAFRRLCGGDPETLAGGEATKAGRPLENLSNIARSRTP